MAKPISRTPTLSGKEATEFLLKVRRESSIKLNLAPTPKLEEAHELIKKHGNDR